MIGADSKVIYPGIDTAFFSPATRKDGLPPRKFVLLFVGNHSRRKGFDLLPEIMEKLDEGFQLEYTGGLREEKTSTGPGRPLGLLTDNGLLEAYRRANALLLPTRHEGFGYAIAEAMACGLPVIASRVSSIPEIVEDGAGGLLCATGNSVEFARAARKLEAKPTLAERMGRHNRQEVLRKFSLSQMQTRFEGLLGELT